MPERDITRPESDQSLTREELLIMGLARLSKFYGYRDVLREVYGDDEDAFTSGWCDGSLPVDVREAIMATIDPAKGQMLLLRRLVRQQDQMLTLFTMMATPKVVFPPEPAKET